MSNCAGLDSGEKERKKEMGAKKDAAPVECKQPGWMSEPSWRTGRQVDVRGGGGVVGDGVRKE